MDFRVLEKLPEIMRLRQPRLNNKTTTSCAVMFNCSACMERCLHGLIGNSSISAPSIRTSVVAATALGRDLSRNYGTSSASSANSSRPPKQYDSSSHYSQTQPRYNARPNSEREPRDSKPGGFQLRRKDYRLEKTMHGVLSKHPVYGSDPVKLAEYARKALKGDDFETALAVVRAASKGLSCTVSWNHLIDWQMSKGKMNAALKTYNEVCSNSRIITRTKIDFSLDEKKRTSSRLAYLLHHH